MLIPLGIWAASGAGSGAAAGAYELIATANGTGSSGTITFSSIPSTYKHLQIRSTSRQDTTGNVQIFNRFNNDSTAVYANHTLFGAGSSVISQALTSQTETRPGIILGSLETTGAFTNAIIDILDYASTAKNKTTRTSLGYHSATGSYRIYLSSGLWQSTSAINRVDVLSATGNFTATSRFSLYGIKG
jgi:hypothetical protein